MARKSKNTIGYVYGPFFEKSKVIKSLLNRKYESRQEIIDALLDSIDERVTIDELLHDLLEWDETNRKIIDE